MKQRHLSANFSISIFLNLDKIEMFAFEKLIPKLTRYQKIKIKNNSSSVELRVSTLEESDKSKQAVLDRIVGIVENNEAQCQSQSSKLQLLEDSIRKTREEMSSSAGSAQNNEVGNSSMISDPETMKKLEERIDQVKSISCSLIEASSEKASDELMTVQENLHEMIMAVEEKVMDASFNASQAAQQVQSDTMSLGGGVSTELLNQQLAEVRVDKDMIIQRRVENHPD
jgi:hypothetical protein